MTYIDFIPDKFYVWYMLGKVVFRENDLSKNTKKILSYWSPSWTQLYANMVENYTKKHKEEEGKVYVTFLFIYIYYIYLSISIQNIHSILNRKKTWPRKKRTKTRQNQWPYLFIYYKRSTSNLFFQFQSVESLLAEMQPNPNLPGIVY